MLSWSSSICRCVHDLGRFSRRSSTIRCTFYYSPLCSPSNAVQSRKLSARAYCSIRNCKWSKRGTNRLSWSAQAHIQRLSLDHWPCLWSVPLFRWKFEILSMMKAFKKLRKAYRVSGVRYLTLFWLPSLYSLFHASIMCLMTAEALFTGSPVIS